METIKVTWQIPKDPKPAHPKFALRDYATPITIPRVGDQIEIDDREYEVKYVLWRSLNLDDVLIVLA